MEPLSPAGRTVGHEVTGLISAALEVVHAGSLGAADCEAVSGGFLAQPVAAASSLAFVVAAAWLARRRPGSGPGRVAVRTYAALLALVGAGSVAYHGPQGPGADVLHDGPIGLVVAMSAVVLLARKVRGEPRLSTHGARPALVAGATAVAGLVAYALGRTGSPTCDPTSLVQPHALWHVLMACALAAWGAALWDCPLQGLIHSPRGEPTHH